MFEPGVPSAVQSLFALTVSKKKKALLTLVPNKNPRQTATIKRTLKCAEGERVLVRGWNSYHMEAVRTGL